MKNRTKEQKYCYKILYWLIKYVPLVSALMLWIHVLLSFLGHDDIVLDHLFGSSISRAVVMAIGSYAFGFCKLHRHLVFYNLMTTLAIDYNYEMHFDSNALCFHQLMFSLWGLILFTVLIFKWRKFNQCNGLLRENYKRIIASACR